MFKLRHLLVLSAVSFFGCTKEYEPPKEAIPDIPPGRSAMKAKGEAEGTKTASPAPAGKKVGNSGGAPLPPR